MAAEGGGDVAARGDDFEALGAGVGDEGLDQLGGDAATADLGGDEGVVGDAVAAVGGEVPGQAAGGGGFGEGGDVFAAFGGAGVGDGGLRVAHGGSFGVLDGRRRGLEGCGDAISL